MNRLTLALLVVLGVLLVLGVIASLGWRMEHDSPIMLYIGFLMKAHGAVPYRDIFDMNAPSAHLLNLAIFALAGSSDLALRIIDLIYLGAIGWLTVLIMRPLGRASAWAGAGLFAIAYLQGGVVGSLQREVLALLPLAGALHVFLGGTSGAGMRWGKRYIAAGVLLGLAASIKPQLLIALPVFLAVDWLAPAEGGEAPRTRRAALSDFAWLCLGVVGVGLGIAVWLMAAGALGAFVNIAVHYWSLYSRLSGDHVLLGGSDRAVYILRSGLRGFAQLAVWYVAAAFALTSLARTVPIEPRVRRLVALLLGMAAATWFGTALAGKFWAYHWLPFTYFTIQLAVVCLALPVAAVYRRRPWVPLAVMVLVLVVAVSLPFDLRRQLRRGLEPPKHGRVDEMAGFLESNLRPGDTVQPLDWTGGAVHAMLLARVPLATSFLYDFHFYHSVSTPYIRDLRRRFLDELRGSSPRFVIMVVGDRPWPQGTDTTLDFPELKQFLMAGYHPVKSAETYTILERNGGL